MDPCDEIGSNGSNSKGYWGVDLELIDVYVQNNLIERYYMWENVTQGTS